MTTKTEHRQSSLKRRIRQFYDLLNEGDVDRCYQMIDPRLLELPNAVTVYQYGLSLRQFLAHFGQVAVQKVNVTIHKNEPTPAYGGRDFAVGNTTLADQLGGQHVFSERWVFEGRAWYTRCTGLVTPTPTKLMVKVPDLEALPPIRSHTKPPRNVRPE